MTTWELPAGQRKRNLELKVRCQREDLAHVARRLQSLVEEPMETLDQGDTYFAVPRGRLKVRTIMAGDGTTTAELIAYHRPDLGGARWSSYIRTPLDPSSAPDVITALAATVDVLTHVQKRRTVARYKETRIHLDQVVGLGAFVELETVLGDRAAEVAEAEYAAVVDLLGLAAFEPVAGSYSDLVIASMGGDTNPKGAAR